MPEFLNKVKVPTTTWANRGSGTNGALMKISDRAAGLHMHNGVDFVAVNGGLLNVLERGLKNDNSTDNSAALQAINDDAGITSPVMLWFPPGYYRFRSAVRINNSNIKGIVGIGPGATYLIQDPATDTTSDLLRFNVRGDTGFNSTGLFHIRIQDIMLSAVTSDRTAGTPLRLGLMGKVHIDNVTVTNALGTRPYDGVVVEDLSDSLFHRLQVNGVANVGVTLRPQSALGKTVEVYFGSGSMVSACVSHGMLIQHDGTYNVTNNTTEGIHLDAVSFYGNGGDNIRIVTGSSSSKVSNVHLQGVILDTCAGNGLSYSGTGQLRSLVMDDCWASYNDLCGVDLNAGSQYGVTNFDIDGGNYILNGNEGIKLTNVIHGRVQNATLFNNSRGSAGAYAGINLAGQTQQVSVVDCRLYNTNSLTGNYGVQPQDGVLVGASTIDCRMQGCYLDVTEYQNFATTPISVTSGATRFTAGGNQISFGLAPDPWVDASQFGAVPDVIQVTDGAYSAASTLTSATAAFVASDVGKVIAINGAASPTSVAGNLTTTSGSAAFTITGASLAQSDVGKWIKLPGAGASGATLYSKIASVTSTTTGTIATTASTSQTAVAQTVVYAGWLTTTISTVTNATTVTLGASMSNTGLVSAPVLFATDSGPAIQSAINTQSFAATVYLPAGSYMIATALTINAKQVSLIGSGTGQTFLYTSGNIDLLSVNVGQSSKYYGMTFGGFDVLAAADQTAGIALRMGNVGQCNVVDFKVSNAGGGRPYRGIAFMASSQIFVDKVRVTGCASHGVLFTPDASGSKVIDVWMSDHFQVDLNLGDGIFLNNSFSNPGGDENLQGIYIGAGSVFRNFGSGVHIQVLNDVKNLFFRGTIIDSNSSIGFWAEANAGVIRYLRMSDVWISFNGNPSLVPAADQHNCYIDSTTRDFTLTNCYIQLGGRTGLTVNGSTRGKIQGCVISDNSQSGSASYAGINLTSTASKIQLQGNRVYNSFTTAAKQNGILVQSTVSDIDITANFFDTNLGGSGTTTRNISSATNVREWGNTYDTTSGNVVPFTDDNLVTTAADVIQLQNTTTSTAGVPVQYSPAIRWTGRAWNTTVTAADNYLEARAFLIPTSAATPTSRWSLQFGRATAAVSSFTEGLAVYDDGSIKLGLDTRLSADTAGLTSTTAANIPGLAFAVQANSTYRFDFYIKSTSSSAAGVKYAITVPSGATFQATVQGSGTSTTAFLNEVMSVSGTLTTSAFNAVAATGAAYVQGFVTVGATAGTVQLQYAKVTSGNVVFNAGSHLLVHRLG